MAEPFEVLERGADFAIASVGSLFITVVRRIPQLHMLDAIDRCEGAFVARQSRPIRSLFVIRDIQITTPPDAAFRAKSTSLMERYGPHLVATSQVIEGDGFKASIIRGFATGITLMSRQSVPTKSFPTVQAAVTWLSGLGTPDPVLRDSLAIVRDITALEPGS